MAPACSAPGPRRGELEGVGQQVERDALELLGIEHRRQHGRRDDRVGQIALRRQGLEGLGQHAQQRGQIDRLAAQVHLAGVEPGQVEQVVDVLEQRRGAAPHQLQLAPLHRGQVDAAGEQLVGRTQDQRQRGAQLVADVGEQVALELVHLPHGVEQALQLGVLARHLGLGQLLCGDVAALGEQEGHPPAVVAHRQQREVDHDGAVAGGLAIDLQVAADELTRAGAAHEIALLLDRLARDLEPARLPERPAADVLQPQAGPFERGTVDLQRAALGIQQADELVHRVEHDAGELLAPGLRVVAR